PCLRLDPTLSMADTANPNYGEQLGNMVSCLNKDGQYADVAAAVDFFRTRRTEDGRSFFDLQVDLLKQLGLSPSQTGFLVDIWMSAFDDGRIFSLLNAVPWWITRAIPAQAGTNTDAGPVLQPLLALAKPLMGPGRAPLRRLEEYGARVLRQEDFPSILKY